MVAQLDVEKPIAPPTQQTIEIGKITLMLPTTVDPKPYIRQILRVDLESITHPKARECLEFGLQDATTDADFSSLIETFHIFSTEANADRFFAALEPVENRGQVFHSVDDLRKEFGLEEDNA